MQALILKAVLRLASMLPAKVARNLGSALGLFSFHVIRLRRRLVERNIALAYGLPSDHAEVRRIARANYAHYGQLLVELFRLRLVVNGDLAESVEFVGFEHLDAAIDQGRGVLALTAHLGNYDLMAVAVALKGYSVTIISKPLRNKGLERIWMSERSSSGLNICLHRNTLREIMKALKANGVVGFILDQHARANAAWVDFFGRPAATLRSLAAIAERTGAPVVPIFTRRLADGRHRIEAHTALELEIVGDTDANIAHNTQRYSAIVEEAIREVPEQWTWIHRRWKERPAEEGVVAGRDVELAQ